MEKNYTDSIIWYAVMRDRKDNDWGYGSRDKAEALKMALELRADGNPAAYVAVIADGPDPVALEELHDLEAELARLE